MKIITQSPLLWTVQYILFTHNSIRDANGFFLSRPTRSCQMMRFAAASKKNMKQKRKNRAPKPFSIPKENVNVPRPDAWEKVQSTEEKIQLLKDQEEERNRAQQEADARAKQLIESQRKSVAVLTHIKDRVSSINGEELVKALRNDECYIVDGFLKYHKDPRKDSASSTTLAEDNEEREAESTTENLTADIASEILEEGKHMYDKSLLELDVSRGITSGEYTVPITGGEQYIHCPRSVEFVVAMTRHLKQLFDESSEFKYDLDNTKTMASYRFYNRQAREQSLQLLTSKSSDRVTEEMDDLQQSVNDTSDLPVFDLGTIVNSEDNVSGNDLRKITLVYYVTPSTWKSIYGGNLSTLISGTVQTIDAVKDRLVIFNSVTFQHKFNPWIGDTNDKFGGVIICHLVGGGKGITNIQ